MVILPAKKDKDTTSKRTVKNCTVKQRYVFSAIFKGPKIRNGAQDYDGPSDRGNPVSNGV